MYPKPNVLVKIKDYFLGLVTTHTTEDIAYLNVLSPLADSDHAVLTFVFRARDIIYDRVDPLRNIWTANISATWECASKTDWSLDR